MRLSRAVYVSMPHASVRVCVCVSTCICMRIAPESAVPMEEIRAQVLALCNKRKIPSLDPLHNRHTQS